MDSKLIGSGLLLTVILLASIHSQAQETNMSSAKRGVYERNTMLSVDTFPLILSGFGLGADQSVTEQFSVGLFYMQAKPRNLVDLLFTDTETDLKTYGLRARYFPMRSFSESGLYLGAAVVHSELKIKTRSTWFGYGPWAEGSKVQNGGQGSIGYQFTMAKRPAGQMAINVAYIYGAGNKLGYEYTSANGGEVTPILEDGSSLEATVGFMF